MAAPDISMSAADIQRQEQDPDNHGPYTLYRADMHGTETPVVANVSEEFAKTVMAQLEAKPHHQGYWYGVPENTP